jgi:hypothetical protein
MIISPWSFPRDLQGRTPAGIVSELRNGRVVYSICYGSVGIVEAGGWITALLRNSSVISYRPQRESERKRTLILFILLISPRNKTLFVRFEDFTAATMKNAVFWDVAPCKSCVNRRFGGISPPSSG